MDRIILIVNIFNMLVVVREVSIYIGFMVVEYYCDMGYYVVIMVDFILCWVEVFCEILVRFEEIFVEEGYLLYLLSCIFKFYECVGMMIN